MGEQEIIKIGSVKVIKGNPPQVAQMFKTNLNLKMAGHGM